MKRKGKSKAKSIFILIGLFLVTGGLIALSYFGIGQNKVLGIQDIKLGLDLSGGVYIVYDADKESPSDNEMATAVALLQQRLDRKGWTEGEVSKQGTKRIRVDIPGVEDADAVVDEIGQTAMVSFIAFPNADSASEEAAAETEYILGGADVVDAVKDVTSKSQGSAPESCVRLVLSDAGKQAFAEATSKYVGKQIYIFLDDNPISAPVVQTPITDGNAIITGNFTPQEAEDLAALIRAGALPFKLNVLEVNNIGARLGAEALNTSLFAGVIGFALVILFMLIFYRVSGLAADWALIIYVALELLALSLFRVTLTLPGIAGIILSIGMAVDANVIIFERIKEELSAGKTLKAAVKAGYSRAFPAILDGNVTTIIAAVILFYLGTGPIRGFAQTLIIGIILSMFTALTVTRLITNNLIDAGIKNTRVYGAKKVKEAAEQ